MVHKEGHAQPGKVFDVVARALVPYNNAVVLTLAGEGVLDRLGSLVEVLLMCVRRERRQDMVRVS